MIDRPIRLRLLSQFVAGLVLALGLSSPLHGGIYTPNEPCYFDDFDAEGLAKPIGYSNFKVLLTEILRIDPRDGMTETKNRLDALERVKKFKARPVGELSPVEIAGYSAEQIRLGREHIDDALNLLLPLSTRRDKSDFLVLSHLARVHQERQEWEAAYRKQSASLTDVAFPKTFPGYQAEQLTWLKRVESKFNLPLMRSRWQEGEQKKTGVQENIDPIFPIRLAGKEWQSVHYTGLNGEYQVGSIAPREAEKLPPDAIAVVQQLILWNPHDPRLHWQLAELYNAKGEVRPALELMDECVNYPRNYSNRTLMEHRSILRTHQDRLIDEEVQKQEAVKSAERARYYRVGAVIGAIVVLLSIWQLKQIGRKWRR